MKTATLLLSRGGVFLLTHLIVGTLLLWITVQRQYASDGAARAFGMGVGWQVILSLFAALVHALIAMVYSRIVSRNRHLFAWWLSATAAVVALALDHTKLVPLAEAATAALFGPSSMWLVVVLPGASATVATVVSVAVPYFLARQRAHAVATRAG